MYIERIYVDINEYGCLFCASHGNCCAKICFFSENSKSSVRFFDRGKTGRYKYCELEVNRL